MSEEIKELKQEMNDKFEKVDKRFDKVENDISTMKSDISTIKTYIADLQVTQTQIISMLKDMQQGQNDLSSHIDWLIKRQQDTEQEQAIKDFRIEERLVRLEQAGV